jgi:fatty-acyl-CoA synthase
MVAYWPPNLPRSLPSVESTLAHNLRTTVERYGGKPGIGFFGRELTWHAFNEQVEAFAGWLRRHAGLQRGDRVALYAQNSPQWLVAYYGTQRADGVVVPVSPMSRAGELRHVLADSGARVLVVAQDLARIALEAAEGDLRIVSLAYADYLPETPLFHLPDWLREPARHISGTTPWAEVLAAGLLAPEPLASADDLALLPYTSGSTGMPKGCEHPHRTFQHNIAGLLHWHMMSASTVFMGLPPMYHVSGLMHCVHSPIYTGGMVVAVPRWDRELVPKLIRHYGATHFGVAPTAVIDMLANPEFDASDLASVKRITSGGATMPAALWHRLRAATGLEFVEAYGMTESAATALLNPIDRPKPECAGIPFFDTHALVADPATLQPLPDGESGEILLSGPQIFRGYWGKPKDTEAAFAEIDGRHYYRSGDIGRRDEDGYFFMTDRLKRMINASGFKVWPAEVEAKLYEHPAVREACVIGAADPYRGETVKAVLALKQGMTTDEAGIITWARERMAAYKVPRIIEFVEALPKSPVGKILWRDLQDREKQKETGA